MTPDQWRRIDAIFEAALERAPSERQAFLDEACNGDSVLRANVESLLAADAEFLEFPAAGEVARLLDRRRSLAGQTLGRFRVGARIGEGGMGHVYAGTDTQLNRKVAIKVISPELTSQRGAAQRFRQEALSASALNHPNIVTVFEMGEYDGHSIIVTELIEGETLRARIRRGPIPLAEARAIFRQVAAALDAAHAAGIVHRDIKPENIMIRADGLVKVLDFGIAKSIASDPHAETGPVTTPGTLIGTIGYMSPEQLRDLPVDARSDIWSLGVVLYESLAGTSPFQGATTSDRLAAILREDPPPLSGYRDGVPARVERAVGRALARNPDDRYQRVADFAEDLESTEPAELNADRPVRFTRRRGGALAALVAVLAIGVGILWTANRDAAALKAPIDSLAVLPLVNAGGDSARDYLADGLTESLINDLSELPSLKVASRSSVFRYKGKEVDAGATAEDLDVAGIVTGRVAQRGETLVVSVELTDARTNAHLWGKQYARKPADLLQIQQEISRDIAEELRVKLSEGQQKRLTRPPTANAEAYDLYLKGRYYWYKSSPAEFRRSAEFFQRAIDIDPTYAPAHAGLSYYYGFASAMGLIPPEDGWRKAAAAAATARKLDPLLPDDENSLAAGALYLRRDWAAADGHFRSAVTMHPDDAEGQNHYSAALAFRGQFDAALDRTRRAHELDPLSVRFNRHHALILYYARRHPQAVEQLNKTLDLDPNDITSHELMADVQAQQGMHEKAVQSWQRALELSGRGETGKVVARTFRERGFDAARHALGRSQLELLEQRVSRGDYVPAMSFVRAYLRVDDHEKALEWLSRAVGERNRLILEIGVDPAFDRLRSDRRFQAVLQNVGLGD